MSFVRLRQQSRLNIMLIMASHTSYTPVNLGRQGRSGSLNTSTTSMQGIIRLLKYQTTNLRVMMVVMLLPVPDFFPDCVGRRGR